VNLSSLNSVASGHLYELPHLKAAECPTAILQRVGTGATWMFEDAYAGHAFWQKFTYTTRSLQAVTREIIDWAEHYRRTFSEDQLASLPWFTSALGQAASLDVTDRGGLPTISMKTIPSDYRTAAP
jgi:hypothetical protein